MPSSQQWLHTRLARTQSRMRSHFAARGVTLNRKRDARAGRCFRRHRIAVKSKRVLPRVGRVGGVDRVARVAQVRRTGRVVLGRVGPGRYNPWTKYQPQFRSCLNQTGTKINRNSNFRGWTHMHMYARQHLGGLLQTGKGLRLRFFTCQHAYTRTRTHACTHTHALHALMDHPWHCARKPVSRTCTLHAFHRHGERHAVTHYSACVVQSECMRCS